MPLRNQGQSLVAHMFRSSCVLRYIGKWITKKEKSSQTTVKVTSCIRNGGIFLANAVRCGNIISLLPMNRDMIQSWSNHQWLTALCSPLLDDKLSGHFIPHSAVMKDFSVKCTLVGTVPLSFQCLSVSFFFFLRQIMFSKCTKLETES